MRLTVKERVLLHLLERGGQSDGIEAPEEATQPRIAEAAGIEHRHVSQYLRPLLAGGLVLERKAHVKGIPQRRRAYSLSDAGRMAAVRLRKSVESERVRIRDATGEREATIAEILSTSKGTGVLRIVQEMATGEPLDLASLAATPQAENIEMLTEAPRVSRFAGRRAELITLTQDEGARAFMVRGVAGIGKSTLAAKACELLRGKKNLFWRRLQTWDTPASVLASIALFIHAVGRPVVRATLAHGGAEQAAQTLRGALPGTNAFLVLDDGHNASADVVSFLRFLKDAIVAAPDVRLTVLGRTTVPFYDRRDVALYGTVLEIDLGGLAAEEMEPLIADATDRATLAALGHRIGGHPLFFELASAHGAPERAMGDLRDFLEEEVYLNLAEPERRMMKLAAIFRVAVPGELLLEGSGLTQEVLRALTQRQLLRPAGGDRFLVHDTVRGFFDTLLSPSERRELSSVAARQLRNYAATALMGVDYETCVEYLSNALSLASERAQTATLLEDLGGARDRLGDMRGAVDAYKQALTLADGREAIARLHRKTAYALGLRLRFETAEARKELEQAADALGNELSAERGWIILLRFFMARDEGKTEEAREYGEEALRVFRAVGDRQGEVSALIEMAPSDDLVNIERWETYLEEALRIADPVKDAGSIAFARINRSWLYRLSGRIEKALEELSAVEATSHGKYDLPIRLNLCLHKGLLYLHYLGDFPAAEASFKEALLLAAKQGSKSETFVRGNLTWLDFYAFRIAEARAALQREALDWRSLGIPNSAVATYALAAEACILEDDLAGLRSMLSTLDDPALARVVGNHPAAVQPMRGLDFLTRGDEPAFENAFAEAFRAATNPHAAMMVHFFYGVGLRALGREEAERHLQKAREIGQAYHRKSRLAMFSEEERRIAQFLRRTMPREVGRSRRRPGPGKHVRTGGQ